MFQLARHQYKLAAFHGRSTNHCTKSHTHRMQTGAAAVGVCHFLMLSAIPQFVQDYCPSSSGFTTNILHRKPHAGRLMFGIMSNAVDEAALHHAAAVHHVACTAVCCVSV